MFLPLLPPSGFSLGEPEQRNEIMARLLQQNGKQSCRSAPEYPTVWYQILTYSDRPTGRIHLWRLPVALSTGFPPSRLSARDSD